MAYFSSISRIYSDGAVRFLQPMSGQSGAFFAASVVFGYHPWWVGRTLIGVACWWDSWGRPRLWAGALHCSALRVAPGGIPDGKFQWGATSAPDRGHLPRLFLFIIFFVADAGQEWGLDGYRGNTPARFERVPAILQCTSSPQSQPLIGKRTTQDEPMKNSPRQSFVRSRCSRSFARGILASAQEFCREANSTGRVGCPFWQAFSTVAARPYAHRQPSGLKAGSSPASVLIRKAKRVRYDLLWSPPRMPPV